MSENALPGQGYLRSLLHVLLYPPVRAMLALGAILVLGMVFHADGTFYKWDTHRDMLRQISVFGILACGMTLVIISGGIDLSVGSVLGHVAVTFALLSIHWGWHGALAVPASLVAGAVLGLLVGAVIARFHIPPFIATLAMMVFARGLAKQVSGGQKVGRSVEQEDGTFAFVDLPATFRYLDMQVFGNNLAVVTIIFLACALFCHILLSRTRSGRYLYAIGGNEEAARLSGVPVTAVKVMAYALCGFFAAVAGLCQAAQETQGDPEAGMAYELTAIAIVVIGGTSLMGGRGHMGLTLLGVLIIGYLDKILSINAVGESSRLMLTGSIILVAVLLQQARRH